MDRQGGYAGRILKIDLTAGSISEMTLSSELAAKFIGGAGLNAWLAYDCIPKHTPPFSPENALVFGAGPLVATLMPTAGKTNFTSKSPLSHFIGTSGSGHMGFVKFAGYDHVVVTGRADRPVYLEIGDEVRIREASHLWGKDTWETTDLVWQELGKRCAVASIGPAGENLVRDACIMANKYSAFAKTGMGAVMGAKNLKAIAANGSRGIKPAEPERFMKLANRIRSEIMSMRGIEGWRTLGTLITLSDAFAAKGMSVPYKNCQQAADEGLMKSLDVELFDPLMEVHGHISCLACPIGCKHFLRLKEGPYAGLTMPLSCAAAPAICFGGVCALEGWDEILKCNELCNRLGMDNACANLVAMAIELYQRGIINKKDTGGLELDWQPHVVHDLLQKIAYREGLGNVLADGLIEAPRHIGRGADYYALHYKGVGNSQGDPRPVMNSWIVGTLTNVIGHTAGVRMLYGKSRDKVERALRHVGISEGDLQSILSGPGEYNVGRLTKWCEDYAFVLECLGLCHFHSQMFDIDLWGEVYSAATGIDMDGDALLKAAARGLDVRKAFNIREGASRKDDTMPERFLTEPIRVGEETHPPFDREYMNGLITQYYEARGWDPDEGNVSSSRLADLVG